MRRILLTTTVLLLTASCWSAAQAQTKLPPRRKAAVPKARAAAENPNGVTMKDGYIMKDGKLLVTRNGHTDPVTKKEMLLNGTAINVDGTVVQRDSTRVTMQEGDMLSLSGRLTTARMKAQQDSLMNAVKEDTKLKIKSKRKGR